MLRCGPDTFMEKKEPQREAISGEGETVQPRARDPKGKDRAGGPKGVTGPGSFVLGAELVGDPSPSQAPDPLILVLFF